MSNVNIIIDFDSIRGLVDKKSNPICLAQTDMVTDLKNVPLELREDYEFNPHTKLYRVKEEIWAKHWRSHGPYWRNPSDSRYIPVGIGGSSIACIYDGSELDESGLIDLYTGQEGSHYIGAAEYVASKQGVELAPLPSGNDFVLFRGHLEEQSIRERFEREWTKAHPFDEIKVENDCGIYTNTLYPYAVANLDGTVTINGVKGLFEAKTVEFTSPDMALWKESKVPLKYYLQCVYYMMVCNLPFAVICVKWGIGEKDFAYFCIKRDFAVEEAVAKMCNQLYKAIASGKPYENNEQDKDLILRYYRRRFMKYSMDLKPVTLDEEHEKAAEELLEIKEQIDELKHQEDLLKERQSELLVDLIKFSEGSPTLIYGNMEITIRKKDSRTTIDEAKVQKLDPKLYKRYCTKFDATSFAKENPDLKETCKKETAISDTIMNMFSVKEKKKKRA